MLSELINSTTATVLRHRHHLIPTASSEIADRDVRRVLQLIQESPILGQLKEWKANDRRGPGGRPAHVSDHALLVGLVLAALLGTTHLSSVHDVLFNRVSHRMRRELGLVEWRFRDGPRVFDHIWEASSYRNVVDAFSRIVALMDPSLLPKNRVMNGPDYEHFAQMWDRRCRVEPEIANQRLRWFANEMIEISIRALPREVRRAWNGSVAIDGTPIRAFARPDRRPAGSKARNQRVLLRSSADPDAGYYIRAGDHAGDRSNEPLSKMSWAYESTFAVMVHDDPSSPAPYPHLVVGMAVLDRPGTEPARQAVKVLESVAERGHPSKWLVVDNLFPNQKPEKFQLPIRELGYEPVFEYTSGQQGIAAEYHGAIQVEGRWYCPQMPPALISASLDRANGTISDQLYRERITMRIAYEFRPNGKTGTDGSQRMLCPAAGTSPTVKCSLKPESIKSPRPMPVVISSGRQSRDIPKVCRQATIKMHAGVGAKFKQEIRFGSDEWTKLYRTSRSVNEGMNGVAKRPNPIDISDPNIRRVRGVAAQTILHAVQLTVINLERIRTYLHSRIRDPEGLIKADRRWKRSERSKVFSPRGPSLKRSTGPPALV
jgi:hypothetical protein